MTIDKMKQAFPERDQSKPAEQQGVFRKFEVRRIDGSDAPGGKHYGCRYFVIDMDHDQYAGAALSAYGTACAKTHPELSSDLLTEFPVQAECHVLTDAQIVELAYSFQQESDICKPDHELSRSELLAFVCSLLSTASAPAAQSSNYSLDSALSSKAAQIEDARMLDWLNENFNSIAETGIPYRMDIRSTIRAAMSTTPSEEEPG